jgi:hypothetical protein
MFSRRSVVNSTHLTHGDEDILGSVVVIDVEVTATSELQTPTRVLCESVDHVVQEANASINVDGLWLRSLSSVWLVCAIFLGCDLLQGTTVEVESQLDLGLVGVAVDDSTADFVVRHVEYAYDVDREIVVELAPVKWRASFQKPMVSTEVQDR